MQEVGGSGSVLLLSHDICACCSAWAVRDCVGLCVAVHGNAGWCRFAERNKDDFTP